MAQNLHIFEGFLGILALAVIIVLILRKLQLPPILGYLIAGALAGPDVFGIFETTNDLRFLAEFGIVFLLFIIGLELSLPKLISMRRALLGLGGGQVVLCSLLTIGISIWAGLSLESAIALAGALSLSSTAVVTKQLIEQNELHQPHGKLILSILLFQDLAAVPFLIIVPASAPGSSDVALSEQLLTATLMGGVVVLAMVAAGRWLLRPLFHIVARARSSELFMFTALMVVLVSAFLTEHLGLSMALGAFLAGVMLAETEYAHQLESDIEPFRDIFLGFFFITVGALLNFQVLFSQWHLVLLILLGIVVFKAVIITLLAYMAKAPFSTALKSGLGLAQGGEFGFALISLAVSSKLLDSTIAQVVIASIILSIALAPFLLRKGEAIVKLCLIFHKRPSSALDEERHITQSQSEQNNHVIICGFGRVGQTLARFLEHEGIPYKGLDLDPNRLKEARLANEPVFFGDASQESVLKAAGITQARLIVLSFEDHKRVLRTLEIIRRLNKTIPILVRTQDDRHLENLQKAGATEVIPEKLESSLMLAAHMLIVLGASPQEAQRQITEVKSNRYRMLRCFYEGKDDAKHLETKNQQHEILHAIEITQGAFAVGKTLESMRSKDIHLTLASFFRNGYKCTHPSPDIPLQVGDVLVLKGPSDRLYIEEEKLLQG